MVYLIAINKKLTTSAIERLHLLKKDTSQIGQNARKAVKFLDDITSDSKLSTSVIIQESEERYSNWAEVEAHYVDNIKNKDDQVTITNNSPDIEPKLVDTLPQEFATKLDLVKDSQPSPLSTPPLSPTSSGPQSSKTSPEVKTATLISNDVSPVPPSLKDLINSVVWYTYEKSKEDLTFLTNSSDTSYLARDFGVPSKNIHQLRAAIGIEQLEIKNQDKFQKKQASKPDIEPRTLFRYEDESEEEEVIFKPRGRGTPRPTSTRGNGSVRSKTGHSPANSLSTPVPVKPQIPTEEIDPDSFDRGSFGRGSIPLASVGNHNTNQSQYNRGSTPRNNFATGGQSRGQYRGGRGGFDRGSLRGRGRLFVP